MRTQLHQALARSQTDQGHADDKSDPVTRRIFLPGYPPRPAVPALQFSLLVSGRIWMDGHGWIDRETFERVVAAHTQAVGGPDFTIVPEIDPDEIEEDDPVSTLSRYL